MHGVGVSAVSAYTAHREWATRPPDERYASVEALHEAARARRIRTMERDIETGNFRTDAAGDNGLVMIEATGRTAALTHWSFEQLATIAGAPPKYVRSLPAPIAADAINYGLQPSPSHATPAVRRP
jgi:acyl-CoA reductase-like NAD-dependent aldehyde dehydrogenase